MNFTTALGQKILPVAKAAAPVVTKIKANSPTILLIGGCACIIGGGILMARAGWKAREIEDLVEIEIEGLELVEGHDDEIETRIREVHHDGTVDMVKQFILPGSLILGGVGMVCCGFKIQGARLVAAVAYSAAVEQAFENYRRNVISDQGPSADAKYMSGEHLVKTDIYEEDEDGKTKKRKEEVVARGISGSPYSMCFDDSNPNWENDRASNMTWLLQKQEYVNNVMLRNKPDGILTLNEVLEELGFPRTPEGQYVGWEYKPDPNKSLGDGYVDFGLSEVLLDDEIEQARTERRNPEPSIWVDFNVDGMVIDKLGVSFR